MPIVLAQHTSLLAFTFHASVNFYNLSSLPECTVHENREAEPLATDLLPLRAEFLYNRTLDTGGSLIL